MPLALDATAQLTPRDDSNREASQRRSALGWCFARESSIATAIVRKDCQTSADARAAIMVAKRLLRTATPPAASVLRSTGSVPDTTLAKPTKMAENRITPAVVKAKLHIHYVHKGGSDGSLSNHRPLALIEVLRKVFTGIIVDRMRCDWSRLNVLDECNPGFQAWRTTASAILPARTAAEFSVATKTEMAVLRDYLKWCFDTPANPVIELALIRLGVSAFHATMLNGIDMQSTKSTVTAAGLALDLAGHLGCQGAHRQLHGTGQGTIEGPLNWLPVADIVIAVARAASTNPVDMPTGGRAPVEVPVAVYVDDSALALSGPESVPSLRTVANATGLM